ncbi:hypothetical protein VM1G_11320 [Cytospora mali]|uniref:Uncharacterized protein n=1 Tax=Cytospora mali TaxID=578113 RepID=A0A194VMB9_CYTMA|nr:hypothetical protein VM1G_11320 [Valsa mali]
MTSSSGLACFEIPPGSHNPDSGTRDFVQSPPSGLMDAVRGWAVDPLPRLLAAHLKGRNHKMPDVVTERWASIAQLTRNVRQVRILS